MSEMPPDDGPWKDYKESTLTAADFPGVLYDGDGTLLAGNGHTRTYTHLVEAMPYKTVICRGHTNVQIAELKVGDRLWLLPDTFGVPFKFPMDMIDVLADFIRQGRNVGLAARDKSILDIVSGALILRGIWEAPPPAPPNTLGTIYDGTGMRLLGNGPATVTLAELEMLPFKIRVGRNDALWRRDPLGPEDRIWLLPETLGTPPMLPADVMTDFERRVDAGHRIGLAGNNPEIGNAISAALNLLHKPPQGSA